MTNESTSLTVIPANNFGIATTEIHTIGKTAAQFLSDYARRHQGGATPIQTGRQNFLLSDKTKNVERDILGLHNPPSPASIPARDAGKPIEEQLFDATANVKILTAQVAMHLDREWRKKLFHQIDSLHDPEEWEAGDVPLKQASFATFLKAIFEIKPTRRPGLGLSHGGYLLAAWIAGKNRLTIEFLPSDRVRWVLSRYCDGEPEQFAGQTTVSRLSESLLSHHPEEWFA